MILLTMACFLPAMAQPASVQDLSVEALRARTNRLERSLAAENQQQLYRQIIALQQELEVLRGVVERQQHTLEQVTQRQQQLEQRLSVPAALGVEKSSTAQGAPKQSQETSSHSSSQAAYESALLASKKKPLEAARQQFEQFIKDYPRSTYVANANYWLGQLLFHHGKKRDASHHFALVVRDFPQSAKVSDAMLKIGLITQEHGDVGKAKIIYQRVVQQYATSPAAQRAKAQLATLK